MFNRGFFGYSMNYMNVNKNTYYYFLGFFLAITGFVCTLECGSIIYTFIESMRLGVNLFTISDFIIGPISVFIIGYILFGDIL